MSINQFPPNQNTPIVSPFKEELTASAASKLNIKPTWGISALRDTVDASGVGADIVEENGLLKISTGLDAGGVTVIQTRQRGQYQAGTQGQVGIALRMNNLPSGTQDARWGYMDVHNGVGFGIDSLGLYTFVRKKAATSKTYQSDWNIGPNTSISATSGNIYHVDFTWYGYGDITYRVLNASGVSAKHELTDVHRFLPEDSASVEDPNLPIRIEAYNGGGAASGNMDLFVGGRQFSVITGTSLPQTRMFSESIINHVITSGINEWEPLMTFRLKDTFGPSDRLNSVQLSFVSFDFRVNQDTQAHFMYSENPSYGGGFSTPEGIDPSETAIEVKSTANVLYGAPSGLLLGSAISAGAGNKTETVLQKQSRITLIPRTEATLWVRKHDNLSTTVSATVTWEEQW